MNAHRTSFCHTVACVCLVTAIAPLLAEDKAPVPPPPPAPAAAKPTKVHVTVIAEDGAKQPLAGVALRAVQVEMRGPSDAFKAAFEGTTDDQGRWTADIPFGEYIVLATRGTLVAGPADHNYQTYWNLNARTLTREIHMVLREGGDLNVRVTDAATQAPLPDARLLLDDGHVAVTDDHGQVKIRGVAMGEHVLLAMKPPFADRKADFNNAGQSYVDVQVAMGPGFQVRGQVRDSEGKPVANAVVRDYYSGRTIHCDRYRCITDAQGRYELGWYTTARPLWSFGVEHKDFAIQSKRGLQPPASGNVVTWDFVLDQGFAIGGVVKDEHGQPIKGALVRYGGSTSLVDGRETRSGDDGVFRLSHIATRREELVIAQAKGFAPAFFRAAPGKDKEVPHLEFTLVKGITMTGRVVDQEGKPISGAGLSPRWQMGRETEYVGNRFGTDKDGNFTLVDLPATGNSIDIYGRGFSDIRNKPFDPHQPLLITVDKPGVIIGKVLDYETGKAITEFNVRLAFPKEQRPPDEPSPSYSAHLSGRGQDCRAGDGSFVIEELVGRAAHAVRVSAEGYLTAYTDRVVARSAGAKEWPEVFRLKRGFNIAGTVTDAFSGKPLTNAQVLVLPDGGDLDRIGGASFAMLQDWHDYFQDGIEKRSDAQGHFKMTLPDAQYRFNGFIHTPGYAPVMIQQAASELPPDWSIALKPGATLRIKLGSVVKADDKGPEITVYAGGIRYEEHDVTPGGELTLNSLADGPAVVTLRRDTNIMANHASAMVMLRPGETTELDLAKLHPATLRCTVTVGGMPAPGTIVLITPVGMDRLKGGQVGFAYADQDGVATISGLPRVPVTVESIFPNGPAHPKQPGPVTVDLSAEGDHQIKVELDPGEEKGK